MIFDQVKRAVETNNLTELKRILQEWILKIEKSEADRLIALPEVGAECDAEQGIVRQKQI